VRGTPYAGKQVLDDFIRPNPFLTSVSIVEGEISPRGMFPFLARELEPIARELFANPKVEVATHTLAIRFSCSRKWRRNAKASIRNMA
jgi:hypothetical protein